MKTYINQIEQYDKEKEGILMKVIEAFQQSIEFVNAMQIIWERMKIIIEPSCAVPFAAVLKNKEEFKNKKIGIILSGGNVDVKNLPF